MLHSFICISIGVLQYVIVEHIQLVSFCYFVFFSSLILLPFLDLRELNYITDSKKQGYNNYRQSNISVLINRTSVYLHFLQLFYLLIQVAVPLYFFKLYVLHSLTVAIGVGKKLIPYTPGLCFFILLYMFYFYFFKV